MNIQIDSIVVRFKFRKDLGDIDSLKESINTYGLLNPIVINKKYELICGHRRLQCIKELGWTCVDVRILDISDRLTMINVGLEENANRKDFTVDEIINVNKVQKSIKNPNIFVKFFRWIGNIFRNIFNPKSIEE